MTERYWITGVQLGMIIALAKSNEYEEVHKLVDEIIDKQFLEEAKSNDS